MGGWKRRATPSCALLRGTSTGFGAGACCAGGAEETEAQEQRRCSQGNEGGWITKNLANLINGSYIKISFNQRAELAAMLGLHYTCC